MAIPMTANEILQKPYARVLVPESDGRYTAEIMEFPGCVTYGNSATEALNRLESVASDWIGASIEQGQDIPEPMASVDYSGKLALRMPKGLHRRAAICAEREGCSLNQFIVTSVAESVGERAKSHVATNLPVATGSQMLLVAMGLTVTQSPSQPAQLALGTFTPVSGSQMIQTRVHSHA